MTDLINEIGENLNSSNENVEESDEITSVKDQNEDIAHTEAEENGETEKKVDNGSPANGYQDSHSEKRQRKKVQRLSETWNRAHEAKEEERAKAAKEVSAALEAGKGTALGDIPLIDATIRKMKPVDLKVLHLIIYGRAGTVTEVRGNLRKFRGFGFNEGSELYTKKCAAINQRPATELREALRILNLEVSGTREQLATRVIEFLTKPSANLVKYKGKVVKKSGSRSHSKKKNSKNSSKKAKSSKSTPSVKTTSSEASAGETSNLDEESDLEKSSEPSLSELDDNDSDVSFDSGKKKKPATKRKTPVSKTPAKSVAKRARKAVLDDSDDEESPKKSATKTTKEAQNKDVDSEDEDTPLSTFASKKLPPSDDELKTSIINLLKTVNLEETSLKVVREKIFSQYPGIDLSGKKEFINSTVKEFLSQA